MCELLGLCFNLPVRPDISFRGFRYREKITLMVGNSFFPDESAQIIKKKLVLNKASFRNFYLIILK